jgi:hypothetical protein
MAMLIFQIARIATKGHPLVEGVYNVPLRVSDNSDCFSTISSPGIGVIKSVDSCLEVKVVTMRKALPLDETGRAVALISADVEHVRRAATLAKSSSGKAAPAPIAGLTLLLYQAEQTPSKGRGLRYGSKADAIRSISAAGTPSLAATERQRATARPTSFAI